jgi:hypothetical protein
MSSTLPLPFDTRRAAHARVAATKARTYARILAAGREQGAHGFIPDELAAAWNCSPNHVAPRITELKKAGRLVETRRTRLTRSRSPAHVYVLPEFAERHRDDG